MLVYLPPLISTFSNITVTVMYSLNRHKLCFQWLSDVPTACFKCHCKIFCIFTTRCYAECGIAMASRLSVVCDDEVSWSHRLEFFENNFTVSWPGVFAVCILQHPGSTSKGTPKNFGQNRRCDVEKSGFGHTKALIFLKRGKVGPRLLLRTNRKSHTCFQLVAKSTNMDDLE